MSAPDLLDHCRELTEALAALVAGPPIVGPLTQRGRDAVARSYALGFVEAPNVQSDATERAGDEPTQAALESAVEEICHVRDYAMCLRIHRPRSEERENYQRRYEAMLIALIAIREHYGVSDE